MLELPVYNTSGEKVSTLQVDEGRFGGEVNISLLKQAIVTYHANRRQGTVQTKGRGDVEGSTRKLFRQKGTGNARRGNIRTNVMRGGGMAFAKRNRDYRKGFPQKMRKAALNSALLAKMIGNDVMVVQGLKAETPKTKLMTTLLKNLKIERSCLLALAVGDSNLYLSSRNIPSLSVCVAKDLNAFDIMTRQTLLVTDDAMQALIGQEVTA